MPSGASPHDTPSHAHPGAATPAAGPPWPYPESNQRVLHDPNGQLLGTILLFTGAVFALMAIGFVLFVGGGKDDRALFMVLPLVVAPALLCLGGGALMMRAAARHKRIAEEVAASGIRCWGRILQATPIQSDRRTRMRVQLQLEAFAAHDPRGMQDTSRYAPGARVALPVSIEQSVSLVQMGMLQPGYFCALLLHPTDPGKYLIDGFANPQGAFAWLA
ncbi:uncharacterized protein CMC5_040750 [Chondromyces crocatus]|uniref:Uncharacterized protein n=1 Tax=Chondromyces crocatus TaxID=52 RepID=A0A0K1EGE7_CHOCO|nr:uncharacterized protein CMC5_040750 [Chondromyces crocatus]